MDVFILLIENVKICSYLQYLGKMCNLSLLYVLGSEHLQTFIDYFKNCCRLYSPLFTKMSLIIHLNLGTLKHIYVSPINMLLTYMRQYMRNDSSNLNAVIQSNLCRSCFKYYQIQTTHFI